MKTYHLAVCCLLGVLSAAFFYSSGIKPQSLRLEAYLSPEEEQGELIQEKKRDAWRQEEIIQQKKRDAWRQEDAIQEQKREELKREEQHREDLLWDRTHGR